MPATTCASRSRGRPAAYELLRARDLLGGGDPRRAQLHLRELGDVDAVAAGRRAAAARSRGSGAASGFGAAGGVVSDTGVSFCFLERPSRRGGLALGLSVPLDAGNSGAIAPSGRPGSRRPHARSCGPGLALAQAQHREDARRRPRHHGRHEHGHEADALEQPVEEAPRARRGAPGPSRAPTARPARSPG